MNDATTEIPPALTFQQQIQTLAEQGLDGVVELVHLTLQAALELGATDVHFDPTREVVRISFRIAGQLHTFASLPADLGKYIANRCKVLAELKAHVSDAAQEGHVRPATLGLPVELRLSTYPTIAGECISIRLFQEEQEVRTLEQLGLPEPVRDSLQRTLEMHDGLLLLAGPAGSGKTTTLYAATHYIMEQDAENRRIVSVEDPVENVVPGIMQTEIDLRAGRDFPTSLRNVLRHDIEVIMLGEVRDTETARIAVEASLTGHLVMSTVHAARTFTVPYRLLEMGVPPYALTGGLRLVIAQRLLRAVRQTPDGAAHPFQTEGLLLAEKLATSEGLRKAIMRQASLADFMAIAEQEGFSLPAQGRAAVEAGDTTWREVYRALAGEPDLEPCKEPK